MTSGRLLRIPILTQYHLRSERERRLIRLSYGNASIGRPTLLRAAELQRQMLGRPNDNSRQPLNYLRRKAMRRARNGQTGDDAT